MASDLSDPQGPTVRTVPQGRSPRSAGFGVNPSKGVVNPEPSSKDARVCTIWQA